MLLLCSEVGGLIQEINKLQSETDTLDEINEALRSRLGMGPGEEPDLTEVCTSVVLVTILRLLVSNS